MVKKVKGDLILKKDLFVEEDLIVFNLNSSGGSQPATGDIHNISGSDTEATLKALILGTRDM